MDDRIKIGDVWYVKETTPPEKIEKEELEITLSREVLIETDKVLVEGSVLENELTVEPGVLVLDEKKFSMPSVSITYKTEHDDMETEYWDNELFLSEVARRVESSLNEMNDIDDKTKEVVIAVIDKMYGLNWI